MGWETDFDEFMVHTVTHEPYLSQNDYGEEAYGPAVTIQARVVYKPELISTGAGEAASAVRQVVSTALVYCSGVPAWGMRDRITLPDGSQPPIIQVRTYPDEDSDHHQVVVV
jgi:hypothetical protein